MTHNITVLIVYDEFDVHLMYMQVIIINSTVYDINIDMNNDDSNGNNMR